jgi:hypothetical protein
MFVPHTPQTGRRVKTEPFDKEFVSFTAQLK